MITVVAHLRVAALCELKSVLFLQRSQYISLYFYVVKKPQKARRGSYHREALKCATTAFINFATLNRICLMVNKKDILYLYTSARTSEY